LQIHKYWHDHNKQFFEIMLIVKYFDFYIEKEGLFADVIIYVILRNVLDNGLYSITQLCKMSSL